MATTGPFRTNFSTMLTFMGAVERRRIAEDTSMAAWLHANKSERLMSLKLLYNYSKMDAKSLSVLPVMRVPCRLLNPFLFIY